jgi:hypothetical protein
MIRTDAVRRAAVAMVDEHLREIQLMMTMLSQRDADALPYPWCVSTHNIQSGMYSL